MNNTGIQSNIPKHKTYESLFNEIMSYPGAKEAYENIKKEVEEGKWRIIFTLSDGRKITKLMGHKDDPWKLIV